MQAYHILRAILDGGITETLEKKWYHEVKMDGDCGGYEKAFAYLYVDGRHYRIDIKDITESK